MTHESQFPSSQTSGGRGSTTERANRVGCFAKGLTHRISNGSRAHPVMAMLSKNTRGNGLTTKYKSSISYLFSQTLSLKGPPPLQQSQETQAEVRNEVVQDLRGLASSNPGGSINCCLKLTSNKYTALNGMSLVKSQPFCFIHQKSSNDA